MAYLRSARETAPTRNGAGQERCLPPGTPPIPAQSRSGPSTRPHPGIRTWFAACSTTSPRSSPHCQPTDNGVPPSAQAAVLSGRRGVSWLKYLSTPSRWGSIRHVDSVLAAHATLADCVADLNQWLATRVRFTRVTAPEVTRILTAATIEWGVHNGWMPCTEVASTATRSHSPRAPAHSGYLDVVFERWGEESVVIEIDRGNKEWSLLKLETEAAQGRTSIWLRWGREPPEVPADVGLVHLPVVLRPGSPRRYTLLPHRPPPTDRRC